MARHCACAATANMSLFAPRPWRGGFPRRLGASFHGGRALTKSCLRVSRPCGFGRLHGTGRFRRPIRWNGCSSNGPRAKKSRRNTGFRPCPKTRPSTFSSTRPNCAGASSATNEELKSELGLAHFEGRSWRGFHHHATLCIAAYGFLIRERAAIAPSGPPRRQTFRISTRPRPRGAADPTRTAYRKLDRDNPKTTHGRAGSNPVALPLLPSLPNSTTYATTLPRILVTQ